MSVKFKVPKHSIRFKLGLMVTVGALSVVSAGAALAQDSQEEDGARKLGTVTVTATKREATLQDVPVAVSVVGEDEIEKAEIQDLGDLQSIVPSLRVGQLQSSANTNFIIRGFGNGANNVGIEPSVGVFIDGVYRSRSAAQIADLPNLERVEVLRGPQSTLFGKNASAGVISIVTREPQFESGGSVSATLGNYNAVRVKGDYTGPLSETVAFSVSGNVNQRDGYANDLTTGNNVNQRDRWGVRGQLLFTPNDDLNLRIIGDFDQIDEVCCVAGNLINGPTGAVIGLLGGQLDPENPFSYNVYNNFDSTNEIENSGVSLQVDYELGYATLTSITALRNTSSQTNQDSDFTSADLVQLNFNDTKIETFTQELRLTSNNTDGRVDWMIGGFYFDESVETETEFEYGSAFRGYADILTGGALGGIEAILGGPAAAGTLFGQAGQGPAESFGQDNKAFSVFGTLDFHPTDRLTATIGLNYTQDEKDAYFRSVNTDVFSALDLVELGVAAGVPATVANDPNANPFLLLAPLQFLPPFLNFPNAVEDGHSEDTDTTYTLRLAYDLSENVNVYGSYATGFKATSWNLSRDSRPSSAIFIPGSPASDPPPPSSPIRDAGLAVNNLTTGTRLAGPEESEVLEIGLKASFDKIAFNVTLFDQTIKGFQSNAFTGTGFALVNAGEQSAQGLEVDFTWAITDTFTLSGAGTFLDPVYDSFVGSVAGDISGTTPSGIPETSTSLAGTYETMLANGWNFFARADWQYESDTAFFDDPANNALIAPGGYSRGIDLVNGSIGIVTQAGLGVSVWGRNVFDDQSITTAFPSVAQAGSISGYPNQPRTYGVTIRKVF
ncbi:MAG: TonB-dependent receptor [Henriciella sp.]